MKNTRANSRYLMPALLCIAVSPLLRSPAYGAMKNTSQSWQTLLLADASPGEESGGKNTEERIELKIDKEAEPTPEGKGGATAAWLGLGTEEASEALTSQLKLTPGVGLVVTYLAPEGPAAKAGLKKNDLLVEFENQQLVLPSQLRKLVQVRKEGDQVHLAYYRAGEKRGATVTLGKTSRWQVFDEGNLGGAMKELQLQLRDLPIRETLQEQMKTLRDSLGNLKFDQQKVQDEVRRSVDEARKAIEAAVREAKKSKDAALNSTEKALKDLERAKNQRERSVIVRSHSGNVKSLVKSDDAGTIVILSSPKPHLTAHDKDGKLIFDGPVDSAEEREKVPRDLWERVEPMLDQMKGDSLLEDEQK